MSDQTGSLLMAALTAGLLWWFVRQLKRVRIQVDRPKPTYPLVYRGIRGATGRRGGWYDQRGRPWGNIRGVDFKNVDWASYAAIHGCAAEPISVLMDMDRPLMREALAMISIPSMIPPVPAAAEREPPAVAVEAEETSRRPSHEVPPRFPEYPPPVDAWDVLSGDDPFG